MEATITAQLNLVEQLIQGKQIHQAQEKLREINTAILQSEELFLYNLLDCEIKLWSSNCDIEDVLIEIITFYKHGSDHIHYAKAKYLYGWYLAAVGRTLDAREVLMESYLTYKRFDDLPAMARALNRLSAVQLACGDYNEAIANLEKCIEICSVQNEIDKIAVCNRNIGRIYIKCGSIKKAVNKFKNIAEEMKTAMEPHQKQSQMSYSLAVALHGNIGKALELMSDGPSSDQYKREQAIFYEYLGWIYNLDGQYIKAVETLKTGLELSMKIAPEGDLISQTKRLLADAYIGLRKYNEAKTTAEEALAVAEKINERAEIAACYRVLAQVAHHRRQKEQAREWFAKAVDIFKLIQSRYELAATQVLMAETDLYDANGRTALLYMAKEYFEAEEIEPYIKRIDALAAKQPPAPSGGNGSGKKNGSATFIAVHPATKKIVEMARHIAGCNMTVLLTGPTGSGKDHLAKLIHEYSGRTGEFVLINCAAVPDTMVEAELFGYAKGAFTSAERDKMGLLEHADGGTVYLNEIGDCTPAFQAKLLEVIETCQVRRLGTTVTKAVDVRFIAATFHDLKELISDGRFRLDLYHRLNEIPIALPALDERKQDIPELIRLFLMELNPAFDPASGNSEFRHVCEWLESQAWPGNVRELKAKVGWLYQMSQGDLKAMSEFVAGQDFTEREIMRKALEETGWNRSETARRLGISEGAVRRRIAKYNLDE
jgi:DNA-binding NtrC family response regulator